MDVQEAYESAVAEINARAQEIRDEFFVKSDGMMSVKTATEMAEKQWLFGNLYALKHKKKLTKKVVTKDQEESNVTRGKSTASAAQL